MSLILKSCSNKHLCYGLVTRIKEVIVKLDPFKISYIHCETNQVVYTLLIRSFFPRIDYVFDIISDFSFFRNVERFKFDSIF